MTRVLIALVMLVGLVGSPRLALAQGRYCAYVDFRQTPGGMSAIVGNYVAGEGYRTTYTSLEMLYLVYQDSSVSVDEVTILWHVELWGGGEGGAVASMIRLGGDEGTILENWVSTGTPATQTHTWQGDADESGSPLEFHLYASNFGGSPSAVAYLRSMSACGSVLPSVWDPHLEGEFINPWPTDEPWARPTPTLWPTPEATLPFYVRESDIDALADTAINTYHYANQQGALDTLIWILMVLLILGLIFRFMKKAKAG